MPSFTISKNSYKLLMITSLTLLFSVTCGKIMTSYALKFKTTDIGPGSPVHTQVSPPLNGTSDAGSSSRGGSTISKRPRLIACIFPVYGLIASTMGQVRTAHNPSKTIMHGRPIRNETGASNPGSRPFGGTNILKWLPLVTGVILVSSFVMGANALVETTSHKASKTVFHGMLVSNETATATSQAGSRLGASQGSILRWFPLIVCVILVFSLITGAKGQTTTSPATTTGPKPTKSIYHGQPIANAGSRLDPPRHSAILQWFPLITCVIMVSSLISGANGQDTTSQYCKASKMVATVYPVKTVPLKDPALYVSEGSHPTPTPLFENIWDAILFCYAAKVAFAIGITAGSFLCALKDEILDLMDVVRIRIWARRLRPEERGRPLAEHVLRPDLVFGE